MTALFSARALLPAVAAAAALAAAPAARADLADETALAERHAPVVRLVEQEQECGPGEPYAPIDIDVILEQDTVALRGPWNPTDLVEIGPSADDLVGRFEHHLDFPGSALSPGCDFERWQRRLLEEGGPAVYAHVATEAARPGKLALQYWFFYVFNDFNNLHEGDWEMIQLVFDAETADEALGETPVEIGYSSHEGAERSDWDDERLELVDGTRPVVYPAAGSHANKYTEALYLGSSAEAGVGCDDTRGPHVELRPDVKTIPSDPDAARSAYPWIAFEGRWGELQPAFFNGPTGPNLKGQWTEPITWAEGWRERSYAVPTSGFLGTGATDFFCTAVETGSKALVSLLRSPGTTILVLAAVVALAAFLATRTRWRGSAPLRLGRRRTWGQVLASAGRMYVRRAPLFLSIGALFLPLSLVVSLLQAALLGGFGLLGVRATGEEAGTLVLLALVVGSTLTLLGLGLVQAATVRALLELDEGREIGAVRAYALALEHLRPLLRALLAAVAVVVVLSTTTVLLPVALWLAVRWSLVAQVVEVEPESARRALRRSADLVRGRWIRVATLVGAGALLTLVTGPLLGALLIVLTSAPLPLLNVVAGVVYALAMPFVALTTSYVYFDARTRRELEPRDETDSLPAEISLA
jgi:hypothetical protein